MSKTAVMQNTTIKKPTLYNLEEQYLELWSKIHNTFSEVEAAEGELTDRQEVELLRAEDAEKMTREDIELKSCRIMKIVRSKAMDAAAYKGLEEDLETHLAAVREKREAIEKSNDFWRDRVLNAMKIIKAEKITDGEITIERKIRKSTSVGETGLRLLPEFTRKVEINMEYLDPTHVGYFFNVLREVGEDENENPNMAVKYIPDKKKAGKALKAAKKEEGDESELFDTESIPGLFLETKENERLEVI